MAEEHSKSEQVEVSDRGLFDFRGKKEKEERTQEEVLVTGVESLHVDEEAPKVEEEKNESLLDKLNRSNSSSSSSDEEEGPDGEKKKKKKKKGLKDKIEEKLHGDEKEGEVTEPDVVVAPVAPHADDTNIAVEKVEETFKVEEEEEKKKGFLEKIKEKLPGHRDHKKEGEEQVVVVKESVGSVSEGEGQDGKDKKGILGKIMGKLPGYHKEESVDTPAAH